MNTTKKFIVTSAAVFTFAGAATVAASPMQTYAHSGGDHGSQAQMDPGMQHEDTMNTRYMLQSTLQEHAAITVPALKAQLLNEPDKDALMQAVHMNSEQTADAVEQAYPGTRDVFLTKWNEHLMYYHQYLEATRANDEAAKQQAKDGLTQFTEDTSSLLASKSEHIDKDELKHHLTMHGDQVLSIIDNMAASNYEAVYKTAHEAYEHMGMTAHYLADNRAKQWHHQNQD
ncbi:MAG TPA: hypothetical protein VD735_07790 [Candidatus Saccharimonadales bacterium]|nr:hypothetical protein [Candidatus Saccharimonadales bacterium]